MNEVYICSVYDNLKQLAQESNATVNLNDDGTIHCVVSFSDIQIESERYTSVECLYAWLNGIRISSQVQCHVAQIQQAEEDFGAHRMDRMENAISTALKTGSIKAPHKEPVLRY